VLDLEYAHAVDLPRRLFVKLPPTDELQRAFVCSTGMGRREVLFYQQLSAEVPLRVPRCYHAASDDSGENYIMLLEHLEDSGCTFRNASSRYSTDYIHHLWNQGAATLIHGDVHDGNLFFDGDVPGFLDWALVARGPAMRDVGYFLAGTLSPEDQQAHQQGMLAYYREQLLANGVVAPAEQELWRQYQWHAAYVWVGATVTLAMGDAWQPTGYVLNSLQCLHSALESLDSVAAIRAAVS